MEKTRMFPLLIAMWQRRGAEKVQTVVALTVDGRSEQSARRWAIHRALEDGWVVSSIMRADIDEQEN